jgi:TolB-like protein
MDLLWAKTYSSENLAEISERGKVQNVLVGCFALAGEIWRISTMLQNARSGEILGSESVQEERERSVFLDPFHCFNSVVRGDIAL